MEIPEEHKEIVDNALKKLLEDAEREDSSVRDNLVREAKRNDLFWHGLQHIFWDSIAMDWRIPTHEDLRTVPFVSEEAEFIYDYVINIIKPHGESIIAALSSDIPSVRFKPFDPDKSTDVTAAKGASDTAYKIAKDNKDSLLFIHALFTLYTEHILGGYTYSTENNEVPPLSLPTYGNVKKNKTTYICEVCPHTEEEFTSIDAGVQQKQCPDCETPLLQGTEQTEMIEEVGKTDHPRTKQIIETYGILNLKVPLYVKEQSGYGYLINYIDAHYSEAIEIYENFDIKPEGGTNSEKFLRSPSQSSTALSSDTKDLVTIKRCWFRPARFNILEVEEVQILKELFPGGARVDFINDESVRIKPESMDDHWRCTKPGLSRFSHSDPICNSLISLQELRNNSINYLDQSLEYSIPDKYADPRVIDFEAYRKSENSPGLLYPATTQNIGDRPLGEFFHSERAATFPKEGVDFIGLIDADAQQAVGDFPSVHGGPGRTGSKTLGEYVQSRAYALQRLSIPWVFLNIWWAELFYIAVKDYLKNLIGDDFFTKPSQAGYDKVWLKRSYAEGDFNVLYPESSDSFPVSAAQKMALITDMVGLNSPEVNSILFSPLNAREIADTVGFKNLKFPFEAQANKQYREIEMMLQAEAIDLGNGEFQTTVPIEAEIDENNIHLEVTADFLCSNTGQDLKMSNPGIYMNVLAHHRMHFMNEQQKMLTQPMEEEVQK